MCGAGESKTPRFSFPPRPLSFRAGAPTSGCNSRKSFCRVKGSDLRFVRSLIDLTTAPPPARLRRIRCRRVLVATSPAGLRPRPAMTTSPVRDLRLLRARREMPSPGRPCRWFGYVSASGIYSHRLIQAACDTQRHARRLATGPAGRTSASTLRGNCRHPQKIPVGTESGASPAPRADGVFFRGPCFRVAAVRK